MYKMQVHQYDLSDHDAEQLVPHHDMIFRSKRMLRKAAREVAQKIREARGNKCYCQVHIYSDLDHDGRYYYCDFFEIRRWNK